MLKTDLKKTEVKMKKAYLLTVFSYFSILLLSNCGRTDTGSVIDTDKISAKTDENDSDFQEEETVDENFSQDPYNEKLNVFFLSKPHGITEWNSEYSYFINCGQKTNEKIKVAISNKDTCGGKLENDTYFFTPLKDNLPDGYCDISIICTEETTSIVQTTKIIIPNPYMVSSLPSEEKIDLSGTMWTNETVTLFINGGYLYSSDHDFTKFTIIDKNIISSFDSDDYYYYLTEKGVFSTQGKTEDKKMILSIERVQKNFPDFSEFKTLLLVDKKNNVFFSSEKYDTLYYDSENDQITRISEEFFEAYGLPEDAVFFNSGNIHKFNSEDKTFSEICPGQSPSIDSLHAYFGNKFFYTTYDCGGGTIFIADIKTCEAEEIGRTELKSFKNKDFLFVACDGCSITRFSSDGSRKTISSPGYFHTEHLVSKDGKTVFLPMSYRQNYENYECVNVLNFENNTATPSDMKCSRGNMVKFIGFLGEKALYKTYGTKLKQDIFSLDSSGMFKEIIIEKDVSMVYSGLKSASSNFNSDLITFNSRGASKAFMTDGLPQNMKYIPDIFGAVVAHFPNKLLIKYADNIFPGSGFISYFHINTNKRTDVSSSYYCRTYPSAIFGGIHDYKVLRGGMNFFGSGDLAYCGNYKLWSANGSEICSIDHEISISHSYTKNYRETYASIPKLEERVFTDPYNGIYYDVTHYIEGSCRKAVETGLEYGYPLGFAWDRLIGYAKSDNETIFQIFSLKKGVVEHFYSGGKLFSGISILNNAVFCIEKKSEKSSGKNLVVFKNGDLFNEPSIFPLFSSDKYDNVQRVFSDKFNYIVYSATDTETTKKVYKSVFFDGSEITETTLKYSGELDYSNVYEILNGHLFFKENNMLKSISLKTGEGEPATIHENFRNLKYLGKTFFNKAVFADTPGHNQKEESSFLILTDGKRVEKFELPPDEYYYAPFSLWNGWIKFKGNLINEDKNGKLEIFRIMETEEKEMKETVSDNNAYYYNGNEIYIYYLPKPFYE